MIPVQTGSSGGNQLEAYMTDTLANDYPVVLDGIDQNSNRFEADLSEFGIDFNEDMNLGRTDDGFLLESTGPTNPLMIEKLMLPSNFEAAQVALKIGNDPPSWVHKLEAFALLANPMLFCVNGINDLTNRRHGSCALVRSSEYTELLQGLGYNQSDSLAMIMTVEKTKKQCKIKNGITLERYEINGDLWAWRRLELSNDNTFSFIQWLETKSKKKM
ncbi:hypothetical protein GQ55_2G345500 [Panicum hallii var. hallii]|uniref:Uncharacterized protein n=1 Tax=Panicum hallii var. hallii TaxID=1504633 RepID=A0A2T7EVH6_9POAL|nr:hypothetical protein GQ55_2G345500 [Panicum hallii var. hallii]PUZ71821.1 hypothetical protein GQ55_2G345500 [Panicum hallii var. hallii]